MGRRAEQKCLFVPEKKEYRSAEKQLKGTEATAARLWGKAEYREAPLLLWAEDGKMGGSEKGAAAQRPGLVPSHHFKYCLHSVSVPSWKILNPMECVYWSTTKMIVRLWGRARKGDPSCTRIKKMLRCPGRNGFKRALKIIKSSRLFLAERLKCLLE